jgi:hypothetical protein
MREWAREKLTYANVMSTIAVFGVLGGGAYAASKVGPKDIARDAVRAKHIKQNAVNTAEIATGAVNGPKVAANSLTGGQIDEATLDGVLRFGGSVPSGTTVTGVWGLQDLGAGANDEQNEAIQLPLPAPVALTNATVNFAPATAANDDDSSCTGSGDVPTAPPGRVCIYADQGVANAGSLAGFSANFDLPLGAAINRAGFLISSTSSGVVAGISGSWAYTAP